MIAKFVRYAAGVALFMLLQHSLLSVLPTSIGTTYAAESAVVAKDLETEKANTYDPNRRRLSESLNGEDRGLRGLSLTYHPPGTSMHSSIHCVGENFGPDAWMYRSCQFRNLCLDTNRKDFVVFPSSQEIKLQMIAKLQKSTTTITTLLSPETSSMALGSLNSDWNSSTLDQLKWFPRVVEQTKNLHDQGYYMLPTSFVMFPFHSMSSEDPSLFIWKNLWPLFVVLQTFGLSNKQVIALRYTVSDQPPHLDVCGSQSHSTTCNEMFYSFGPLLGHPRSLMSMEEFWQEISSLFLEKKSPIICAPYAGAGMGMLSDNNAKHPHENTSSWIRPTHNHGRGGSMSDFSQYLLQHLGLKPHSGHHIPVGPLMVTFAVNSVDVAKDTRTDLNDLIRDFAGSRQNVIVQRFVMDTLPILEQARIAMETSIFVSIDHSGAASAIFMSPGSSLIVLDWNGEVQSSSKRQSWDFISDALYLRFHWLALGDKDKSIGALRVLMQNELDSMWEEQRIATEAVEYAL